MDQTHAKKAEQLSDERLHAIEEAINELVPKLPTGMVDVRLVDEREIQRLNRMYREKDKVTDVLSFSYLEDLFDIDELAANTLLGDVAICLEQAHRQKQEDDLELELTDLLVHGVLHVLGYDHEHPGDAEKMFPLQDKIVGGALLV